MSKNIDQLLAVAGPALCVGPPQISEALAADAGGLARELMDVLRRRNGFFAFESALHVFPAGPGSEGYELVRWNEDNLWRGEYGDLAQGFLFFAEDIIGSQFALRSGRLFRFDPETGESEEIGASLEEWATLILSDYEYETGYPLAHEWQREHGRLPPSQRLVPTIPLVLGGDLELKNVHACDAVEGMQQRACIARQIRDLPDGATISLRVT